MAYSAGFSENTAWNAAVEIRLLRKILLKLLWLILHTQILSSDATQRVQDAINELTVEKINTEVTLLPIAIGSWSQQINLMIAGGDALDLLPTFYYGSGTFDAMRSSNQLMPLNDLLEEYGQDILRKCLRSILIQRPMTEISMRFRQRKMRFLPFIMPCARIFWKNWDF